VGNATAFLLWSLRRCVIKSVGVDAAYEVAFMGFRALLFAATFCSVAVVHAQEYNERPLPNARRDAFIRRHAECVQTYTQRFEASNALPADVAEAALEACASWMDDMKREIPSFEDRDTTVAKIEGRARRSSIKQMLEARLAAVKK
jgi:hypothetical protein